MVERQVAELLHQPAGPADGRTHPAFSLAQTEKHVLTMLRKKSRSGLKHARLATRFSFDRDRRADSITITLYPAQTESNRRREILHQVLQKAQLRRIAVFQKYFQPAI